MEDEIKVSELPMATQVNNDDLLMIIQGQANKKVPVSTFDSTIQTELTNLQNQINNFNLSIFESPTNVTAGYGNISTNSLTVAKNSDGTLAKIYGNVAFTGWTVSGSYIMETVTFKTTLRPTSAFTIKDACMTVIINNSNQQTINWRDLTINTDGTCTTSGFAIFADTGSAYIVFPPMLYWIKDFGDEPVENS